MRLLGDLSKVRSELISSNQKLQTAETQVSLLGSQLSASENSLTTLNASIKKELRQQKIRSLLIGGGVGIILGSVVTGLIVGMSN